MLIFQNKIKIFIIVFSKQYIKPINYYKISIYIKLN